MGYSDIIARGDVSALIPEDVQREIIQGVPEQSVVMRLGRRLPDMARAQRRIPVLASLVEAQFVNGDTGLKQTSDQTWSNKFLDAEELAVIVPVPEAVLADQDYDLWGEIRPRIIEAFGKKFDKAVFFGDNAPASWPTNLLDAATAAGNSAAIGSFTDIYDAILGLNGIQSKVEQDGYMVSGHVAAMTMKARLRSLRDGNGQPIFMTGLQSGGADIRSRITAYELDGAPLQFPMNGMWDAAQALEICGDWTQLVWALRQDITWKIITEGVITDGAGEIVHNLPQQDMIALRAVIRLGWQVPNPINRLQEVEANRYPFAALTP